MAILLCNDAFRSRAPLFQKYISERGVDVVTLYRAVASGESAERPRCVLPTARLVRSTMKNIFRDQWELLRRPTTEPEISTLDSFIRFEYARLVGAPRRRLMSDAFRFALFREAIETCVHQRRFLFYSRDRSVITQPVAERLADVVYGIKRKGISPDDMRQDLDAVRAGMVSHEIVQFDRYHDIWVLFDEYERLLGSSLGDMPGICAELQKIVDSHPSSSGEPQRPLLFDSFSEFTLPELRLLGSYAATSTPIAFVFALWEQNHMLFGNALEASEFLRGCGYHDRDIVAPPSSVAAKQQQKAKAQPRLFEDGDTPTKGVDVVGRELSRFEYLQRHLFASHVHDDESLHPQAAVGQAYNHGKVQPIQRPDFSSCFRVLATQNKKDELQTIAKYVRHCLEHENIEPSEIAIVARQPQQYSALIREIFGSHDIPLNVSDRFRLATAPVISAIFSAVDVVTMGYRRDDLLRALTSPFLRMQSHGDEPQPAVFRRIAGKLRLSGGFRNNGLQGWIDQLEKAERAAHRQLQTLSSEAAMDETELRQQQSFVESLQRALADIRLVSSLLPENDATLSPREFREQFLRCFISNMNVETILREDADRVPLHSRGVQDQIAARERIEQNTRAYSMLLNLLEELEFILHDRGIQQMRFREYCDLLRSSVRGAKYQVREKNEYGVHVTSIEQTRGIPYRVMILCGMVDLDFPLNYSPEHFLGKELSDSEERHYRTERMSFYHAVCNNPVALNNGSVRVLFTYPQARTNDEKSVVSPFIKELHRVCGVSVETYATQDARQRLRAGDPNPELDWCRPWIDAISSADEELEHAMKNSTNAHTLTSQTLQEALRFASVPTSRSTDVRLKGQLSADLQELLSAMPQQTFSASELEEYATCPYKYFASRILKLNIEDTDTTSLSPVEQGTILHQIVYEFYHRLGDSLHLDASAEIIQGADPHLQSAVIHLRQNLRTEYLHLLHECARSELSRLRFNHPFFGFTEDELFGLDALQPGILERWLDSELERSTEWQYGAVLFEYGFGMRARSGSREPVTLGNIRLKGKIDRIEVRRVDTGHYEYMVADYKSTETSVASNSSVISGSSFQIPLYIHAARALLDQRYAPNQFESGGGVYYIFKPKKNSFSLLLVPKDSHLVRSGIGGVSSRTTSMVVDSRETMDTMLHHALEVAEQVVIAIGDGSFDVTPQPSACKYCQFGPLCRINELQAESRAIDAAEGDDESSLSMASGD